MTTCTGIPANRPSSWQLKQNIKKRRKKMKSLPSYSEKMTVASLIFKNECDDKMLCGKSPSNFSTKKCNKVTNLTAIDKDILSRHFRSIKRIMTATNSDIDEDYDIPSDTEMNTYQSCPRVSIPLVSIDYSILDWQNKAEKEASSNKQTNLPIGKPLAPPPFFKCDGVCAEILINFKNMPRQQSA